MVALNACSWADAPIIEYQLAIDPNANAIIDGSPEAVGATIEGFGF